jgi:N-dimethylarginine dimethylaminohydrolase
LSNSVRPFQPVLTPVFCVAGAEYFDPREEVHQRVYNYVENDMVASSRNDKPYNHALALKQTQDLHNRLVSLGGHLIREEGKEGLLDQIYTADPSFSMLSREDNGQFHLKTIWSRFYHDKRQPEVFEQQNALTAAFTHACDDLIISQMQSRRYFEGGDHLYDMARDIIWGGYKPKNGKFEPNEGRSEPGALADLATYMGMNAPGTQNAEAVGIEVVSPFYHLDTSFSPLPRGEVVCCPDGMTKDSFKKMIDIAFTRYGLDWESNLILVSRDEAEFGFDCNLIPVDENTLVVAESSRSLALNLRERGYDVHTVDLSEILRAGGGPHCGVNRINQLRVPGGLLRNPNYLKEIRAEFRLSPAA